MAAHGTCPDCGKRYRFREDKVGKTIQCRKCGGAIAVASGDSAFRPGGRTERRPVPAKLTSTDRSDVVRAGLRGVTLLLLALFLNLASWGVAFAMQFSRGIAGLVTPSTPAWLTLASSIAMVLGLFCWVGIAPRIERREVVVGAVAVQIAVLLVHFIAVVSGGHARLPEMLQSFLGTANWASFVLLTTILQKFALILDRMDLRDAAEDTVRYGVGVVFFGLIGGLLPGAFLPAVAAIVFMSIIASFLCMLFWLPNYARLLVWLRSAMAEAS